MVTSASSFPTTFFNNALNDDFSECIAALTSILLSVSPESSTETVCPSPFEFLAESFCDNGGSVKNAKPLVFLTKITAVTGVS